MFTPRPTLDTVKIKGGGGRAESFRDLWKGKRLWENAEHHFRDLCKVRAHSGSRRKVSNINAKMRRVRNFNVNALK